MENRIKFCADHASNLLSGYRSGDEGARRYLSLIHGSMSERWRSGVSTYADALAIIAKDLRFDSWGALQDHIHTVDELLWDDMHDFLQCEHEHYLVSRLDDSDKVSPIVAQEMPRKSILAYLTDEAIEEVYEDDLSIVVSVDASQSEPYCARQLPHVDAPSLGDNFECCSFLSDKTLFIQFISGPCLEKQYAYFDSRYRTWNTLDNSWRLSRSLAEDGAYIENIPRVVSRVSPLEGMWTILSRINGYIDAADYVSKGKALGVYFEHMEREQVSDFYDCYMECVAALRQTSILQLVQESIYPGEESIYTVSCCIVSLGRGAYESFLKGERCLEQGEINDMNYEGTSLWMVFS